MAYGKTPMKKKGSMMHMEGKNSTHVNTDKNYSNDGHLHYKDGKKIPTLMKNKGSMMKHGKGPHMSEELTKMPLIEDTTIGGRASSIVNAGTRSRMSGQPQMNHKGSPAGAR